MDDKKSKLSSAGSKFCIALVSVIVLVLLFYYSASKTYCSDQLNLIGDSFGILNALFSGLAFAGIVYTVLLQRIDLLEQQEQIENSKKEATNQHKANLKIAKLNALCSIFQHYNEIHLHSTKEAERNRAKYNIELTAAKIDELLKEFDHKLENESN